MRILLVEDDEMIGESLRHALKGQGYAVDWVKDGNTALLSVDSETYDIILLDLGLPKQSGIEVLETLRKRDMLTPVLILTARDAVEDRIAGLDSGADDYLVKPFELKELEARMRAVLRRKGGRAEPLVTRGAITLDPATHLLSYKGQTLLLSAREFALMHCLLEKPGVILSRAQLEEKLYGWNEEVGSNAVEVHIHNPAEKTGERHHSEYPWCRICGWKNHVKSIRRYLLIWLLPTSVIGGLIASVFIYLSIQDEVDELFDAQIRIVALTIQHEETQSNTIPKQNLLQLKNDFLAETEDEIAIDVWNAQGALQLSSQKTEPFPRQDKGGYATIIYQGHTWRIFTVRTERLTVQVSQPVAARHQISAEISFKTLLPLLILIPLLASIIWIAVGRGLKPLNTIRDLLYLRNANSFEPLPVTQVPFEVRPLISALDNLLTRLADTMAIQKAFIADAAHELRTPLTAISLQLELVERLKQRRGTPEGHRYAKRSVKRCVHLYSSFWHWHVSNRKPPAVILK